VRKEKLREHRRKERQHRDNGVWQSRGFFCDYKLSMLSWI
jgi:hypothetical protein